MVYIGSVILAFANKQTASNVNTVLMRGDVHVNGIFQTGAKVLEFSLSQENCLIICSFNLRDMTALDLYDKLPDAFNMLLLSNEHQYEANQSGIVCLRIPISQKDLLSSVRLFRGSFQEAFTRREETRSIRTQAENVLIQKAKDLLIARYHLSEPQAHRFIQKRSMNTGSKLAETARIILDDL